MDSPQATWAAQAWTSIGRLTCIALCLAAALSLLRLCCGSSTSHVPACDMIYRQAPLLQEPADPQDPIYRRPNVIALPHAGVCAVEVYDAYAQLLCDNIVRKHENKPLLNQLHL